MTARRVQDLIAPQYDFDEKQLTLAFQHGDADAFDVIHDQYQDRVQSICRRMLCDKEAARDASQETFMRVYQALGRFNGRYQLGSWIARIATNVCLDQLRARGRRPLEAVDPELLDHDQSDLPGASDPEEIHIKGVEGRRVRRTLSDLPPLHRAAIVMRDLEGFSYRDVAIALDLSEMQVKALLHRARKRFRKAWQERGALGFVSWRLWQRARHIASSREHTGSWLGGTIESVQVQVASCGAALQQCGQILNERAAAVVAVTVVTGAAAGVALAAPSAGTFDPRPVLAVAQSHSQVHATSDGHVGGRHRGPSGPVAETAPRAVPTAEASPTAPPPAPVASPSPPPEEPDGSGGQGSGSTDATATSPAPSLSPSTSPSGPMLLNPALGFSSGDVKPRPASSYAITARCDSLSVDQMLRAGFAYQSAVYPAALELHVGRESSVSLEIWPDSPWTVHYDMVIDQLDWSGSGDFLNLAFSGSYRGDSSALPQNGRFSANLRLDCASSGVVTESLVLTT